MRPLWPAVAAGVALVAVGALAQRLPAFALRPDIVVSAALSLSVAAWLVAALYPLRRLGHAVLLVAAVALALGAALTWAELLPLANVAKVVGAAALGLWVAENLERASWVVLVAAVSAVVDVLSVYGGPTRELLDEGPQIVGYFTVALTWFGYATTEGYTALGISDVVFFSLYLTAARRFGLRPVASAVAMVASFVVTIVAALWWEALPALPLLSVAFLAVNADRLWRLRGAGQPAT
jgi:hypothetical protein